MNAVPSWLVIEPPRSLSAEIVGQLALLQCILRIGFVPTAEKRAAWAAEAEEVLRRMDNATVTEREP